jgi:hypothetical protein
MVEQNGNCSDMNMIEQAKFVGVLSGEILTGWELLGRFSG